MVKMILSATFVAALVVFGGSARAEEAPSNAELFRMLQAQQQQIAAQDATIRELRQKLDRQETVVARVQQASPPLPAGVPVAANAVAMAHDPVVKAYEEPASSAVFSAGAEAVFAKAHGIRSSGQDFDYEAGGRYFAALEGGDGLGVRFRYFDFDQSSTASGIPVSYEYSAFDAELTKRLGFAHGDVLLAAGYRHAETAFNSFVTGMSMEANGLTVAIDGQVQVLPSLPWLSLVGGARWSLLYGDLETNFFGVTTTSPDNLTQIVDLRAGAEIDYPVTEAGTFTLGGGAEGSYQSVSGDGESGLLGFYLRTGYRYEF